MAARNPSIEGVTNEVLGGVSAPAHAVTMEPSSVVIVQVIFFSYSFFGFEMCFVTFKVLHELLSYLFLFQIHFCTLNPILYRYLIIGC